MTDPAGPTPEELMQALQAGCDEALDELMARWEEPLLAFTRRYVESESDAVDLAQETFVRLYQYRANYRPGAKFSTWLFSIAANLCKNHLRWLARHPAASRQVKALEPDQPDPVDSLPSAAPSPDESSLAAERALAVRSAIDSLPDDMKTAILLSEYHDLPHQDIGEVLGCSAKAVESRLYRARQVLRDKLARFLRT